MILLDISVFATSDANWSLGLDPYVQGANQYLSPFNMRLNVHPLRPTTPPLTLPLLGPIFDPPPDDNPFAPRPGDVRSLAQVALPQQRGIAVIFCKFSRSDAGLTTFTEDTAANRGIAWKNYCMINESRLNSDHAALLHELIHAADYIGDTDFVGPRLVHDLDQRSIMRANPNPILPPTVFDRHALALEGAYFARPT
jgi:hypothetical protein